MIRDELITALQNKDDNVLKLLLMVSMESDPSPLDGTLKERVFEAILRQFESIEFAKDLLKSHDFLCPKQFFNAFDQGLKFLDFLKTQIGSDFPQAGKVALMGIFIKLYPTFLSDDTPDMSVLMAELDQTLNSLQPFVNLFMLDMIHKH